MLSLPDAHAFSSHSCVSHVSSTYSEHSGQPDVGLGFGLDTVPAGHLSHLHVILAVDTPVMVFWKKNKGVLEFDLIALISTKLTNWIASYLD